MPAGRERDERPREEDDKERPVSPGLNGRACVGTYHGSPSLPVRAPLWTRIPNPCIGDRHAHGTRRRRDALPMLLLLCNVSHPESRVPPAPAQPAARGQAAWSPQPGGRAVLGRVAWTCRIGVIPSLDTGTGTPTVAYLYSPGRTACVVESISSIVSRHFRSDVGQPIRLLSLSLSLALPVLQGRAERHMHAHTRALSCASRTAFPKPTTQRLALPSRAKRRTGSHGRSRDPGRLRAWRGGRGGGHTAPNDRTRCVDYVLGTSN